MTAVPPPPQGAPSTIVPPPPRATKSTSGLAVAALIVGIFGFCVPGMGLVAVLLAGLALMQMKRHPERVGGQPLAVMGLAVGAAGTIFGALFVVSIVGAVGNARAAAQFTVESSNMRQIVLAQEMYALDYAGYSPRHPTLLIQSGYVSAEFFVSPAQPESDVPSTEIPAPTDKPFRYGDYFFTYPHSEYVGDDDLDQNIVMFGIPIPDMDNQRHVALGDGSVTRVYHDDFERMIESENKRRTEQGVGPQIDLDALPGALPGSNATAP